jgi:hypothetical protein
MGSRFNYKGNGGGTGESTQKHSVALGVANTFKVIGNTSTRPKPIVDFRDRQRKDPNKGIVIICLVQEQRKKDANGVLYDSNVSGSQEIVNKRTAAPIFSAIRIGRASEL